MKIKQIVFGIIILCIVVLFSACAISQTKSSTNNDSDNIQNTSPTSQTESTSNAEPTTSDDSKSSTINTNKNIDTIKSSTNNDTNLLKVIDNFISAIKNNDANAFKNFVSPSGLVVIRSFSSGNGSRGADVRDLYVANKIPANLQFEVSGEQPIVPHELFRKSQLTQAKNIPFATVNDNNFNFKDDSKNNIFEPSIDDVRDICSGIPSSQDKNNQYDPKLFYLGNTEISLTESALVDDSPVGAWAVFEKKDDNYYLRAIIDLR